MRECSVQSTTQPQHKETLGSEIQMAAYEESDSCRSARFPRERA